MWLSLWWKIFDFKHKFLGFITNMNPSYIHNCFEKSSNYLAHWWCYSYFWNFTLTSKAPFAFNPLVTWNKNENKTEEKKLLIGIFKLCVTFKYLNYKYYLRGILFVSKFWIQIITIHHIHNQSSCCCKSFW